MLKRGQLSVFLLVGLVLVIAVSFVLYLQTQKTVALPEPEWSRSAVFAIDSCFETQATNAIALQMARGGYVAPLRAVPSPLPVLLAVDDEKLLMPTLQDMADNLVLELPAMLDDCANQSIPGFTLTPADATVKADYNADGATVRIDMPIKIAAAGRSYVLPEQLVTVRNANLAPMRDAAEGIATLVASGGGLPVQQLANLSYGVKIMDIGFGYSIISFQKQDDVFNIAVHESGRDRQSMLFLNGPTDIVAQHGSVTRSPLDVTTSFPLTYSTDAPWASVANDELVIDSNALDPGTYFTAVHAVDSRGAEADMVVKVVVQ
jgi:hypothetical protein